jgi:hypothetical protein
MLFLFDFVCSDHNQIQVTQRDVETINELLNNSTCPENVTLVQYSDIPHKYNTEIGLCPFELVINHDSRRNPAVIVEAKCTNCCNHRCSLLTPATCTEFRAPMNVTYLESKREETIQISTGCFCASRKSETLRTRMRPHPRRR